MGRAYLNAAAAAFNAGLWMWTGNPVSFACMIFSGLLALAFAVIA